MRRKPEDYLIRDLPEQKPRVETGPVQFGKDWPGLFIRGDNAFYFAMHLDAVLKEPSHANDLNIMVLRGLLDDLRSCKI